MKKLLQLKLYSFLSTKSGMVIFVLCLFLSFNSLLQLLNTLLLKQSTLFQLIDLNSTKSFENTFLNSECIPEIDIVYTWVNGSDPRQIDALKRTKRIVKGEVYCNSTQNPKDDNCIVDEESLSRFIDNQELKYSLRSIEKFAPWVRHIYLVTNGQVPHWLNLTHPKISVIPHSQLFLNPAHLPTFSSPAIEVHLHRIPNLSKKFIYFNDDTLFGNEVWPDDFFTQSGGQKIFLAWPVPQCNEGCAPGWIGDGYCDLACNVSECQWDAGDCANYTGSQNSQNSWNSHSSGNNDIKDDRYCASGCPDSWVGDGFCDRACNNKECGFDGADCEIKDITEKLYGVETIEENSLISLPSELLSAYFNLSGLVKNHKILDASHNNSKVIRTSIISLKNKLLVLTFKRNQQRKTVGIFITVDVSGTETEMSFNISVESASPVKETTEELIANDTSSSSSETLIETSSQVETLPNSSSSDPEQVPSVVEEALERLGISRNSRTTKTNTKKSVRSKSKNSGASYEYHKGNVNPRGRKLLDMYGDSLKYVNSLLTIKFGSESRRVPAHMPHMIDKDIVTAMQDTWPAEFEATSSHKLRDKHDMQFALTYFYFLMNQRVEFNWTIVWNEQLDLNQDGFLDDNEIRNLLVNIKELPLPKHAIRDFKRDIFGENETYPITKDIFEQHQQTFDKIKSTYGKKKKNRYQMFDTEEVAFVMVGTNSSDVRKALDGIRHKRQKFVCLNDNINHTNPHSLEVVEVLQEFYKSLFPLPSSFELPEGTRNPFLYLDEFQQIQETDHVEQYTQQQIFFFSTGILLCCSCLILQICLRILNPGKHHRFSKIMHA